MLIPYLCMHANSLKFPIVRRRFLQFANGRLNFGFFLSGLEYTGERSSNLGDDRVLLLAGECRSGEVGGYQDRRTMRRPEDGDVIARASLA